MRAKEKKATTTVIAKAKTLVGQTIEITHYTNPANPYEDRFDWTCKGCGAEELGHVRTRDTREVITRDANRHAGLCRVIPA